MRRDRCVEQPVLRSPYSREWHGMSVLLHWMFWIQACSSRRRWLPTSRNLQGIRKHLDLLRSPESTVPQKPRSWYFLVSPGTFALLFLV